MNNGIVEEYGPLVFACRQCIPEINEIYPNHRVSDRMCRFHYLVWGEREGMLEPDEITDLKHIRIRHKIEDIAFFSVMAIIFFASAYFVVHLLKWAWVGFRIVGK